jgi:hypothetical protein
MRFLNVAFRLSPEFFSPRYIRSMPFRSGEEGAAAAQDRRAQARRSFSARARHAAFLQPQGHSRKETAAIIGVAPETISVWKRHPQWQLEIDRWRELAEAPPDRQQQRLRLESLAAASEALEQTRLTMESATKRVRTSSGLKEVPDWPTRLKAKTSPSGQRRFPHVRSQLRPQLRGAMDANFPG